MKTFHQKFTASWTLPRIVLFLTFMTASAYTQRALKYCACAQNVSDVSHGLHILRCWHTPRPGVRGSQVPRLCTECVRFWSLSLFVAMCCYLPSLFVARCCYLLLFTVLIYCYLLLFTILIYWYLFLFISIHRLYLLLFVAMCCYSPFLFIAICRSSPSLFVPMCCNFLIK